MKAERAKAAFNIRDMTYLLDGGKSATEVRYKRATCSRCVRIETHQLFCTSQTRERMMLELERDLVFRMYDFHDLTKDELRERTMEKVRIGSENVTKLVAILREY